MSKKDYLEQMTQNFGDEQSAIEFTTLMCKYISPDQVVRKGCEVTCHAKRKTESWFLTLLVMNITFQKVGAALPKEMMACLVKLASDMDNQEVADWIEKTFAELGMSQLQMLEEIKKMQG